ncbi:MAG: VWA domain-containing protein [Proteobacteria bacterium]|nr:VWA domain-containing protein [Pseudomonadota bacterium]
MGLPFAGLATARTLPTIHATLVEKSHAVEVTLGADNVATWTIRRDFINGATTPDTATFIFELPDGGVMTSLRVREGTQPWRTATLAASAPKGSRIDAPTVTVTLDDAWRAIVFVDSITPSLTTTLEYTVVGPAQYVDGRDWLIYPRADHDDLEDDVVVAAPAITVRSTQAITIDGKPASAGVPVVIDPRERSNTFEIGLDRAPIRGTWIGRFGRAIASNRHALARLEIDVTTRLSTLPVRAQIVFAVDASYSMTTAGIAAQLGLIRAYLTHVPDAEVEILAYRRTAQRVFGSFLPAKEVAARLAADSAAFALGNGSALDDAIAQAITLLADRQGPRRLVLATDTQLRSSLATPALVKQLAALPRDVIVHVVEPARDDRPPTITRADDATLAKLVDGHHGIYARTTGFGSERPTDAAIALALVRPLRIERLTLVGAKLEDGRTSLGEGEGLRVVTLGATAPTSATISGKLWNDSIRLDVAATRAFDQRTATLLWGAYDLAGLTKDEEKSLAALAKGVTDHTSLFVVGRTTPRSFYDMVSTGGRRFPGGGRRSAVATITTISSSLPPPDLHGLVDGRACYAAHPRAAVELAVELTGDEIVDVTIIGTESPLADCLVETFWSARATSTFRTAHVVY